MYRVTKNQSKATQNLALLLRYISGRNGIFKRNKKDLQQNPKRACLSKNLARDSRVILVYRDVHIYGSIP